jgi:Thioredoxin-like
MAIKLFSFAAFATLVAAFFFITSSHQIHSTGEYLPSPDNDGQPEELGLVHWLRDLDAGRAAAQKTGKPLLILFQEVPGCSNCTRYGNSTLSHPLIVEAIETYFVPVCIYNNQGGNDAAALKTFKEPSWNNPVVRIVRADFEDLAPRISNFNSPAQLVRGIQYALQTTGNIIPQYLELLQEELLAREAGLETATFSMYCFWSGEGTIGSIPGVIETEPGFQDGKEVVKVQFDPHIVKKADLEVLTQPKGIQACARNSGFSSDREPKYYLAQTDYKYIPMTSLQACRANSLVGKGQSPNEILSPRQLFLLENIRQNPKRKLKNAIGCKDLKKAWAEAI